MLPIVTDMHDLVRAEVVFLHCVHKHIGFGLTGIELIGPIPLSKKLARRTGHDVRGSIGQCNQLVAARKRFECVDHTGPKSHRLAGALKVCAGSIGQRVGVRVAQASNFQGNASSRS